MAAPPRGLDTTDLFATREHAAIGSRRVAALDGLRGLAVAAVVLFHQNFSWASGGFLGVTVFFALSGYLITTLLLDEHDRTGTISLRNFWGRRFRRLLPAALTAVALVLVTTVVFDPDSTASVAADARAAVAYGANWHYALAGRSYAAVFSAPSPLQHFWSLAIEEQFYVFFPIIAVGALKLGRRWFTTILVLAFSGSVAAQLLTYDADMLYYGTHTRAAELLAGALLAVGLAHRRRGAVRLSLTTVPPFGPVLDGVATAVMIFFIALVGFAHESDTWLRHGGFAATGVAACVLVLAGLEDGLLSRALAWEPLRQLGIISYGLYLYHWPVFTVLDETRTGLDGVALFAARIVPALALAYLSHRLIEDPVRRVEIVPRAWFATGALTGMVAVFAAAMVLAGAASPIRATDELALQPISTGPLSGEPTRPTAPAVTPTPASAQARRVAVVGDSTGVAVGYGLEPWAAANRRLQVLTLAKSNCSLMNEISRFGFEGTLTLPPCDFEKQWDELTGFDPDVVLVISTGMEVAYHRDAAREEAPWRTVGDPNYDKVFLDNASKVIDRLHRLAPRAKLLWANGAYIVDKKGCTQECGSFEPSRMDDFNELVDKILDRHREVALLDLARQLNDPAGSTKVDRAVRPDGVHLDRQQSRILASKWLGPYLLGLPLPGAKKR